MRNPGQVFQLESHSQSKGRYAAALLAGIALVSLLMTPPCRLGAEETPPAPAAEPAAPPAAPAVEATPKRAWDSVNITFHGFITQAWAISDGNEINGIPPGGTSDYRAAALQMRAEITPQDTFAIQFSHERIGESSLSSFQQFQRVAAIDWVFYEHRFGNSAVKVGQVQIPFGIYNEVRDVGTLQPFYRPAVNFYGAGSYTSETVDGAVLSHTFDLGGAWSLVGDVYSGSWDFISRSGSFIPRKVRDSFGAEAWLETPVSGLRVGVGGIIYDVLSAKPHDSKTQRWSTHHVSVDWHFGQSEAQSEYKYIGFEGGGYYAGYVHLGTHLGEKFIVNGQYEYANLAIDGFRKGKFDRDIVLGLNYAFRSDLVLKTEHHWNNGYTPEVPAQNFFAPELKTQTWLVSLAASF